MSNQADALERIEKSCLQASSIIDLIHTQVDAIEDENDELGTAGLASALEGVKSIIDEAWGLAEKLRRTGAE